MTNVWIVEHDYGHGRTRIVGVFAADPDARAFAAHERQKYGLDIWRPDLRAVLQAAEAQPQHHGPEDIDVTEWAITPAVAAS
jgi:hypothetical protein